MTQYKDKPDNALVENYFGEAMVTPSSDRHDALQRRTKDNQSEDSESVVENLLYSQPSTELSFATEDGSRNDESANVSVASNDPIISFGLRDAESTLEEVLRNQSFEDHKPSTSTALPGRVGHEDVPGSRPEMEKNFFVLSSAGKPIYSRFGSEESLPGLMGVLQAIISFYEAGNDRLLSFSSENLKVVVSIEGPIYLVAISGRGESEAQLKYQLDAIYTQILGTLTNNQIKGVFAQSKNFDLRRLLQGTDTFLDALTDNIIQGSPSILLGGVECLQMKKSTRDKINSAMLSKKSKNLLYAIIAVDNRLVTIVRPKRHSLYPPDLLLLFSMLFDGTVFREGDHWTPICLPKFNSRGFLHAHNSFICDGVAMSLISADRDAFYELQDMKEAVVNILQEEGHMGAIKEALNVGRYSTARIGEPLVRHFLYKSKKNVQFFMPSYPPAYDSQDGRSKLFRRYHILQAEMFDKRNTLKLKIFEDEMGIWLGWYSSVFEFYCLAEPALSKHRLITAVNTVLKWLRNEEESIFVTSGGVF